MASIIHQKNLMKASLDSFIKSSTDVYASHLTSTPMFVTYYSKDHFNSTSDSNLHSVSEIVGAESPVEFNKIENVPIYDMSGIDFGTNVTDFGVEGEVTGSGLIIPDTVIPRVDDYFIITNDNIPVIFKITNVTVDTNNSKQFFQLNFELSAELEDQLNSQSANELVLAGDLESSTKTSIVKKSNFLIIQELEAYVHQFISGFNLYFYDPESSTYLFKDNSLGHVLSSNSLNDSIRKHKLNVFQHQYRNESPCINVFDTPFVHFEDIISLVLKRFRPTSFYLRKMNLPVDNSSPLKFSMRLSNLFAIEAYTTDIDSSKSIPFMLDIEQYLDAVEQDLNPSIDTFSDADKVIINWYQNDTTLYDVILELLPNIRFDYTLDSMFKVPMLIAILKQCISQLVTD